MKGVDTNVLLRFLLNDDPAQSAQARALVEAETASGGELFINRAVLCETVWVLRRAYRMDKATIAAMLDALLSSEGFRIEDHDAALAALAAWRAGIADFPDALIGHSNHVRGCTVTVTFDRRAARLDAFDLLSH